MFLELSYKIIPELNLIFRIEIFGLRWCGLEGIGISLFFQGYDALIKFLYLLFLAEKLILLLFKQFFPGYNVFHDLFIAGLSPLNLLSIHISISFQFFNEIPVFSLAFLLLIQFILELAQTLVNSVF